MRLRGLHLRQDHAMTDESDFGERRRRKTPRLGA